MESHVARILDFTVVSDSRDNGLTVGNGWRLAARGNWIKTTTTNGKSIKLLADQQVNSSDALKIMANRNSQKYL